MSTSPLVSISCITYNHAKFIKQALDGFLAQKTDFSFEVLIHDDASNDGTAEIIKDYQEKYPKIIKPIFQSENQYSKGIRGINAKFNFGRAQGKYIALCEGDDYWSDPTKLQRQVDFLEKNRDYSLCFHPVKIHFETGEDKDTLFPAQKTGFTVEKLLRENFIQTNSVLYRKQNYNNLRGGVMPGDWYLHLYHAQYGKIGFINRTMGVYRRHPGGVWWQTTKGGDIDEIWKRYGVGHLILFEELLKIYGDKPKYRDIVDNHIAGTISAMSRVDEAQATKLLDKYASSLPGESDLVLSLSRIIYTSHKLLENGKTEKNALTEDLLDISRKNEILQHEKEVLEREKEAIFNSKIYKVGLLVTAPYRIMKRLSKGVQTK